MEPTSPSQGSPFHRPCSGSPPRRTHHLQTTTTTNNTPAIRNAYGGGSAPGLPHFAHTASLLPRVPTMTRSRAEMPVSRPTNRCAALPPTPHRKPAEAHYTSPNTRPSSTNPLLPPLSDAIDSAPSLSNGRHPQQSPETAAAVVRVSPGSSATSLQNTALLSLSSESLWLEQLPQSACATAQQPLAVDTSPQQPTAPHVSSSKTFPPPVTTAAVERSACSLFPAQLRRSARVLSILSNEDDGDGERSMLTDVNTPPTRAASQRMRAARNDDLNVSSLPPPAAIRRIQAQRGRGTTLSDVQRPNSLSEAALTSARRGTTARATSTNTTNVAESINEVAWRLRDQNGAPSKVALTSSLRTLRAFLSQHPPAAALLSSRVSPNSDAPGNGHGTTTTTTTAAYIPFTEEEKDELEYLLNDLQLLANSAAPPTAKLQGLPFVVPVPQAVAATTQIRPRPPSHHTTNAMGIRTKKTAKDAAPATARFSSLAELTLVKAKPIALVRSLRGTPYSTTTQTSTQALSCTIQGHQDASLEKNTQSVEGRYKEALKTIESAAGDCQVALQRVQEYSESLYVLVQTWMHLHDNRFDEFARAVLQRLLENNPSYRVLFYRVNVDRQSLVILDMIGRAVVAFTRPADLMDIMGEMGARHNLYGVTESHFISMRDAFLQVYAEFVSPDTYNESVGVWRMFWKTTIELAVSGGSSNRGTIYTQRRNVVWAERVTSACELLIPRQRSGGFHRLMQATYKRAVARHPELDVFQQMAELRTAHRCMEALLRIVKSVTEGGVPAVIEYNDQLSIQALFTDCGAELDAEVMVKMEEPFLEACEFYLAPTASWNIVVRAALQELWSVYIAGYWTAQPATGDGDGSGGTAPDGKKPFCLMFTDIEASTRLWDCDTQTMGTAVREHHKLIRGLIEDFGGYEVKTVGDSFLIATNDVTQALLIAFGIQLELMAGPSAPNFRMVDSPQGTGAASCWREDALRVRVGIHYCTDATAVYDSVHNRFDYYGPSVNCAARVEAAACGGQVLLSHGAYEQLKAEDAYAKNPLSSLFAQQLGKLVQAQEARGISVDDARLSWFSALVLKAQMGIESAQEDAKRSVEAVTTMSALTHVEDEGLHPLKGIAEPVQLYSLLPLGLTKRVFGDALKRPSNMAEHSNTSTLSMELSSSARFSCRSEEAALQSSPIRNTNSGFL